MSVVFVEGRELPKNFRVDGYHGYGADTGQDITNIARAISPWDFLKGTFVDKPIAQAQAQAEISATQAQTAIAMQQEADIQKRATMKTVLLAGAGLAGLFALVLILRPAPRATAGYRKSRRSKRSRR